MPIGKGSCNGTFGELLQGVLNDRPFLVTLPIPNLQSNAVFVPYPTEDRIIGSPLKTKAVYACEKLVGIFGVETGGLLYIDSNIPTGKGMASSSADIVASLRAIADSYSLPLTENLISDIASEIEPTDGVMYEGVIAYDYINGQLIESFGSMPPFGIIGIDVGGSVDTIQFNQQPKNYNYQERTLFCNAYDLIKIGIKNNDLIPICKATTMSAYMNEAILPKSYLYEFEKLASICNGGLIVAHSGTMLGILFDPYHSRINEFLFQSSKMINNLGTKRYFLYNIKSICSDKKVRKKMIY
jgi:L-threonine kinase